MKEFLQRNFQSDFDEIKRHKVRFAVIVIATVILIVFVISDNFAGEEVDIDEPIKTAVEEKVSPNQTVATSDTDANVKIVLGANANDLYIHDPFEVSSQIDSQPAQVKIPDIEVTAPAPIIFQPPPQAETPKVHEKIILRGIATGENPTALIEIISIGDSNVVNKNLLMGIGDNLSGRRIVSITDDCIIFDDGAKMQVNTEIP